MPRAAAAASIRVREIVSPDDAAIGTAHRLLRATFSRNERVPLDEWRATLLERARGVWTDYAWHLFVAEQRGRVLGLATGTYLGNVNIGIIGYLAIDAGARAAGLGSRLRRRLRAAFLRDARVLTGRELAGIVGEVSPDNPWLDALARKQGVLVLDIPYFQPRLHPGDRPSPFVLYYESIGTQRHWLSATEVRRMLYAIWRRAYRISRPLERPAFRRMLRSLAGRNRVGPLPASPRRTR